MSDQPVPQFNIRKAEKRQLKARIALLGPPGSGKTYSALGIAQGLAEGGRTILVDTEHRTSEKFAHEFDFDVLVLDPETVAYNTYSPVTYTAIVKHCAAQGYGVIIIDSLSHAWMGKDGALEQVDKRSKGGGNSFTAWGDVTPLQREMVETILAYPGHVIATMRTKIEHATGTDARGKMTIEKIGTKPIQRDDMEYEFDIIGEFDQAHNMTVTKTRLKFLDRVVLAMPGRQLGLDILADLNSDAAAEPATCPAPGDGATAAAPAPAEWAWPDGAEKNARTRMKKLGYTAEESDALVAGVKDDATINALADRLKREKAEGRAPAQEAPVAGDEGTQDGADAPSGGSGHPDAADAPQAATAQPETSPVDFDAPGGKPAQALNAPAETPEAAPAPEERRTASPEELLQSARAMFAAKAVPAELSRQTITTTILRSVIAEECGIPMAQQGTLLMELGLDGWEETDAAERLAILWAAQQQSEAGKLDL